MVHNASRNRGAVSRKGILPYIRTMRCIPEPAGTVSLNFLSKRPCYHSSFMIKYFGMNNADGR